MALLEISVSILRDDAAVNVIAQSHCELGEQ